MKKIKLLALLLVSMLSINLWGADKTLTETFESATTTTTYNSTQTISADKSSCGIAWSIYYGSPSTTSKITGNNSCLIRYYTSDAKLGYAQTTTPIKGLKKIVFNAKVTNTGNKMGVWYSTNNTTWIELAKDIELTTTSASKSYDITSPSSSTNYYIRIGISTGSTTNKKDLIIDDVVFTYDDGAGTAKTLESIAVSGTPTKTTYEAGENFDPAGLTVMGHYSDNSDATITSGINWSYNPSQVLTLNQTSIDVKVTVSEVTSTNWYTVSGLTVTAPEGDKITCEKVGGELCGSSTYSNWTNDVVGFSGAVYKGNSAGSNNSIQLRSSDDPSGIVSTTSGGIISKVKVEWESHTASGRVLNIYGSHDPYTSVADLRDDDKQGTLLGTITKGTSTELSITADEYEYVGVCSNSGAMYLTSITFVWEAPVLNVSFNLNGGTGTQPDKITDFPATLPSTSDFTKTGCRPNGWNTQADGKGTHYNDGASFSAPAESVKLYVEWVKVYSVTYKGNYATGGVAPEDAALHDENSDVTVLDNTGNLYKTGYTWSGWNTNNSGTGTNHAAGSTFKITANTDLYAKWVAKQTTVTLSQGVVTIEGIKEIIATYGQAMPTTDVTMPSRTGYDFKGYYDDETEGTQYYYSTGNSAKNWNKEDATATLFARWQVQVYDITYRDQNDGAFHGTWPDPDTHPKKHTYGVETQLVNPTRTGYTFDGWFGNSECKGVAITAIEGDAYTASFNIYAKWTAKNYTVTFNKNSEEAGGSMDPQPFAFDEQKALTENKFTAPAHKHFAGWAKTSDGAVAYADGANYKLTSEGAELFAVWAYNQTTITLDKQGGTGGNTSVTATYGSAMPSAGAVPNKTGYDFNGYYTEGNGKGKQYYSSTNASVQNWDKDDATLTLYAYWTPKTITITLNKGDHGQADGTATFVYNEKSYKTFTAVEPTTGYTLDGYYTTATGGSLVIKNDGTLGEALYNWIDAEGNWIRSSDGELYAHYTPINYPVTWLVNGTEWTGKGGSTEAAYNSKITNVPITLPTTSECDDEKVFMGWTANEIDGTTDTRPTDLFTKVADAPTITGETKYYAVFATASANGAAPVNTVLWGENFAHFGTNTPSAAGTGTGTTIYDGASISYTQSTTDNRAYNDKGYAGGTLPELFVKKSNTTWTVSNIKTGKANTMSLTFLSNKTAWSVTTSASTQYTISNDDSNKQSWTLTLKDGQTAPETINLTFKNTNSSDNARIDNVELKVTDAGISYSAYATECEAELPAVTITGGGTFVQGGGIGELKATATPEGKVTYQWQKSDNSTTGFEDIDGATNSSYTPDNSTVGTLYYRCVVTNRDKSATSDPVSVEIIAQTTCATPSFTITGGGSAFIRETEITMTTTTDEADIYYTLDNTTPSTSSTKYTGPVKITATTTVKAIAAKVNMTNSSTGSATFTKATLQSIAVKTAPKTEYTALETFDPTDLVITATYNYDLSEEVDYANHSSEFTFNPSTSTPLNVTDNTISITWEQKSTTQAITVNPIAMTAPEPSQTANDFTSVTIEWAADAHANHYEVAWNGGAYETATSPYTKTGLTYSSNYTYKVKVVGATNYGTAETEALNASTKTREVASIKDVVAPTKTYYVGDQVKNTDITCTVVYNNNDEEQGNPQFVGFASNPTSATTATLTDAQVGTTTIYVKSANTELTTTITVEETPKHMFVDRVNGNTTIVKEGMGTQYDVPTLTSVVEACTYAPNNNVFKGWIDSEFEGDVITDADLLQETKLTIAGGKTFYAVWAEHKEVTTTGTASSSSLTTASAVIETGKPVEYESGATYYNPLRIYAGNKLEIKGIDGAVITAIDIIYATNYTNKKLTPSPESGTTSDHTWVGEATTITFTNNLTEQTRVSGLSVAYKLTEANDVNYISDCVVMYELTFDANGGTGTTPETIKLKEGGKTALPDATLTKDLNDLTGWNTKANGQGTHYDFGAEYTMGGTDAKLYAEFTPWTLNNITLDASNATTEFYEDEYFTVDGLEVNASYTGANSGNHVVENISGWTTDHDQYLDTPFGHDYEGGVVTVTYQDKTATYNITVTKLFNANFYVWGEYYTTTATDYDGYITMPVIPESDHLVYKDFVGWSKTQFDAQSSDPEMINDFYEPVADGETFYAVFGRASGYTEKTMTIDYDAFDETFTGYNWHNWTANENIYGTAFCTKENNSSNLQFNNKNEQQSTIFNYSMLPGEITSITINRKSADKAWTAYVGKDFVGSADKDLGEKDPTNATITWTANEIGTGYRYFQLVETDDNTGAAYVSSFVIKYNEPTIYSWTTNWVEPDHVRTGLTMDKAGTICLPYAVKADDYKGASVWSIESRTGAGTMISSITLVQEVDNDGNKNDLVAGKPYIFFAEESEFQLFYSGDEYTDNESVWANGLIGNLDVNNIVINGGGYQPGSYLISQNKLLECGTDCQVPQYRAYVEAEKIGAEPIQAPIMAPRRVIGNPNGTPTNLNGLNSNGKAQKALIDGHIYILRDNKMYNAQGIKIQ